MRTPAVWQALLCCVRIKPQTEFMSIKKHPVKDSSELLNRYFWSFASRWKPVERRGNVRGCHKRCIIFGERRSQKSLFYLVFNAVPNVKDAINRNTVATSLLGNLQNTMIILYLHKCFHPESLFFSFFFPFFFLHMTVTRTVSWLQTLIRSHC